MSLSDTRLGTKEISGNGCQLSDVLAKNRAGFYELTVRLESCRKRESKDLSSFWLVVPPEIDELYLASNNGRPFRDDLQYLLGHRAVL